MYNSLKDAVDVILSDHPDSSSLPGRVALITSLAVAVAEGEVLSEGDHVSNVEDMVDRIIAAYVRGTVDGLPHSLVLSILENLPPIQVTGTQKIRIPLAFGENLVFVQELATDFPNLTILSWEVEDGGPPQYEVTIQGDREALTDMLIRYGYEDSRKEEDLEVWFVE